MTETLSILVSAAKKTPEMGYFRNPRKVLRAPVRRSSERRESTRRSPTRRP